MVIEKLKNQKHFLILSYYLVIIFLYRYTERIVEPKYIVSSRLDDYIPFVKGMVIPYLFWYIYIALALIYFGLYSKKDFYRLAVFMFIGMTLSFMIYLIFPNGQNLRPDILQNDLLSKLIRGIYLRDTPTNCTPSMHVLDAIAVHIAIIKSERLKDRTWIKMSSLLTMVLIIASTVMIKQHSILDVLYAIVLSLGLYLLVYQVDVLRYFRKEELASNS